MELGSSLAPFFDLFGVLCTISISCVLGVGTSLSF